MKVTRDFCVSSSILLVSGVDCYPIIDPWKNKHHIKFVQNNIISANQVEYMFKAVYLISIIIFIVIQIYIYIYVCVTSYVQFTACVRACVCVCVCV